MNMKTRFKTAVVLSLLVILALGSLTLTVWGLQETRVVGNVPIAADEFVDLGGGLTRARGNVRLGTHFYLTGPSDVVVFDATTLNVDGSLAFGRGSRRVPLFSGAFDFLASTGAILRNPGQSFDLRLAGFAVDPAGTNLIADLRAGEVRGLAATYISMNPAGGEQSPTDVMFTLTADSAGRPVFTGDVIEALDLTTAGVRLYVGMMGATLDNDGIVAETARLTLPEKLGGLSINVPLRLNAAELSLNDGLVFTLPEMLFGDGEVLKIRNTSGQLVFDSWSADYRLYVEGDIIINLPENAQTIRVLVLLGEENGQPVLSGSLDQVRLTVAETTLQLQAVEISLEGLFVEVATLTLPENLGSGRVFVYNVSVTPEEGLQVGAWGGQMPIPQITIGDPDGPYGVIIHGGYADMVVMEGEYTFQFDTTLEAWIPESHLTSTITLRVANGDVSGRVHALTFNVAGATLLMEDVLVTSAGLWVDFAQLSMPESLGNAAVYIADVSITAVDGLILGAAGVAIDLPDIHFPGADALAQTRAPGLARADLRALEETGVAITNNRASLNVRDNFSRYEFAIVGTLRINLPENRQIHELSFTMGYHAETGVELEGYLSGLTLHFAGSELTLENVRVNHLGLTVDQALLVLPEKLGGPRIWVNDIVINGAGLTISDGGFQLPLLKLAEDRILVVASGELTIQDGKYAISARGTATVRIPENVQTVTADFMLDYDGNLRGTLSALKLNIAGVTLELAEIRLDNEGLETDYAKLVMPDLLGGAEADITQVRITRAGLDFGTANVTVNLPEIHFGHVMVLTQTVAQLDIVNTRGVTPTTKYQFTAQSQMWLRLPDNPTQHQSLAFTMTYAADLGFALAGEVSGFDLVVAGAELHLYDIRLTGEGLSVAESVLKMPESLGGTTLTLTEVSITRDGLGLGAALLELPDIEFTLGARAGRAPGLAAPAQNHSIALFLYENRATFGVYEGHYRFSVNGKYHMGLPGGVVTGTVAFSLETGEDGDYRLEGVLPSLRLTNLAGATLDITDMRINNDGFFVSSASLILPEDFGTTSVTVADVSITAAGLQIGDGTISLPDITFADENSQIKIVAPTARIQILENAYVLACSGTLQLRMPGNSLDAALNFTLADGQLSGGIAELDLLIAGWKLDVQDAHLDRHGLRIALAQLHLPENFTDSMVTFTNVSITSDGLQLGAAFTLPEYRIGDGSQFVVRNIRASLAVSGTHYTLEAGGRVELNLPDNALQASVSFAVDSDGNIRGGIDHLRLDLAGARLEIVNMMMDNDGFFVSSASVTLPESLSRSAITVTDISITEAGLQVGGGVLALPDITFAEGDGRQIKLAKPTAVIRTVDNAYVLDCQATLQLQLPSNHLTATLNFMLANGELSGGLEELQLLVAGWEFYLRDAQLDRHGFRVTRAEFHLPEEFADSMIVLEGVSITGDGLQIAAGGFALPEYRISDALAVRDITAQLTVSGTHYALMAGGTLDLNLPDNAQQIALSFAVDSDGNFHGDIDRLSLTVVGSTLEMQRVVFHNAGLFVDAATFYLPEYFASRGLVAVAVTDISISDGLNIGSGEMVLQDIIIGDGMRIAQPRATLMVAEGRYGLAVSGQMIMNLPQNSGLKVQAKLNVDAEGNVSGTLDSVEIKLASVILAVEGFYLTETGVAAETATVRLPAKLGGGSGVLYDVRIDRDESSGFPHISIGGGTANIPFPDFQLGGTTGFHVTGVIATLELPQRAWQDYKFTLNGTVGVFAPGENSVSVSGELTLDRWGNIGGQLSGFELTVAGLALELQDVQVKGEWFRGEGYLSVAKARLAAPEAWGGMSVAVYQVQVPFDGSRISIGGGEFDLPEFKVAGFTIAGRGGLIPQPEGGYRIRAGGKFGVPSLATGSCALGVGFDVYLNPADPDELVLAVLPPEDDALPHAKVLASPAPQTFPAMPDAPAAPDFLDRLELREVAVGMSNCTIPIGASGFFLTRVEGTFNLSAASTRISLGVGVSGGVVPLLNIPIVTGDLDTTVEANPFVLELQGAIRLFGLFQTAGAHARIDAQSFSSTLWIDAIVARGEFTLSARSIDGKFSFSGSGTAEIAVPKGKILNVGVTIPKEDWFFTSIAVQFGEFAYANKSVYGIRGTLRLLDLDYGVFVDTTGVLTTGNDVNQYRLVNAAQMRRYLAAPALMTARGIEQLQEGHVLVRVPVAQPTDMLFGIGSAVALPGFSLVTPEGVEITPDTPPDTLPDNVQFIEQFVEKLVAGAPVTFTEQMYIVQMAQAGEWEVKLSSAPGPEDEYDLVVFGLTPPPALDAVSARATGDTTAEVGWEIVSPEAPVVSVYATTGPITYTTVITQEDGMTGTATLPLYTGIRVTEEITALTNGTPQTVTVDLRSLPSGDYWLWIEANDNRSAPVRRYAPAPITVQQARPTGPWDADIDVAAAYRELALAWTPYPSPDIEGYGVYLSATPGGATALTASQTISAGLANSAFFAGLEPNHTYYVAVEAYNVAAGWTLLSTEQAIHAPGAEFTFAIPAQQSLAGGTGQTFAITLTTALAPYPDVVALRVITSPDGIDLHFPADLVTPTVTGTVAQGVINVSETLAEGVYILTLAAEGGGVQHEATLAVQVREPRFMLQGTPTGVQLPAGQARHLVITADRTHGHHAPIDLHFVNPPAGLLWELDRFTLLPGQSATLRFTDTALLEHGTYALRLEGTANLRTEPLTLTLQVAKSDFTVQVVVPDAPLFSGREIAIPIQLTASDDWTAPVTLSLEPQTLPDTFVYTLTQATVAFPATTPVLPIRVDLMLRPAPNTPAGTYLLRLLASGGEKHHRVPFYVTVVTAPPSPPETTNLYLPLVLRQR